MNLKAITTIAALALMTGAASVQASSNHHGDLHLVKNCTNQQGNAGDYCVITESNLPQIPVGSKLFYTQPGGIPAGYLDSNVLLTAGTLHWAVGRCTFDFSGSSALCNFTDGVGPLAGFRARVKVTSPGHPIYRVDGSYILDVERKK